MPGDIARAGDCVTGECVAASSELLGPWALGGVLGSGSSALRRGTSRWGTRTRSTRG